MSLRMPGHYEDPETKLFYNRHRYYDSNLGRYVQSDPLGLGGGFNTQSYSNNPLTEVDLEGLTHLSSKKPGGGAIKTKEDFAKSQKEFGQGRSKAKATSSRDLFKPAGQLDPNTSSALSKFDAPGSTYGANAKKLAKELDGMNGTDMLNHMKANHGPPRVETLPSPPGTTHTVQQSTWELPDGTTVRVKETIPPGNKVDPFRTGPTQAILVRKPDLSGNPLPDSFQNEAFKVDSAGNAVPKSPKDIDPRHSSGMTNNEKDGFIRNVMDRGHTQTGR